MDGGRSKSHLFRSCRGYRSQEKGRGAFKSAPVIPPQKHVISPHHTASLLAAPTPARSACLPPAPTKWLFGHCCAGNAVYSQGHFHLLLRFQVFPDLNRRQPPLHQAGAVPSPPWPLVSAHRCGQQTPSPKPFVSQHRQLQQTERRRPAAIPWASKGWGEERDKRSEPTAETHRGLPGPASTQLHHPTACGEPFFEGESTQTQTQPPCLTPPTFLGGFSACCAISLGRTKRALVSSTIRG